MSRLGAASTANWAMPVTFPSGLLVAAFAARAAGVPVAAAGDEAKLDRVTAYFAHDWNVVGRRVKLLDCLHSWPIWFIAKCQ